MDYALYIRLQQVRSDWSYGSKWGDAMEEAITQWFAPNVPKDASIIDIGCGEGRGLLALRALGYKRLAGIDVAQDKLWRASAYGLDVHYADMHELGTHDPSTKYDYVFTSHTLEHAYDLEKAIQSILRIADKAIYIIIPIYETKEFVMQCNPEHTAPVNDPKEFTNVLDKLGLKYTVEEKQRMCAELWVVITL